MHQNEHKIAGINCEDKLLKQAMDKLEMTNLRVLRFKMLGAIETVHGEKIFFC